MTFGRKLLVLFSLLAILFAAAMAQSQFAFAPAHEPHAGCHAPAPKAPLPASYSCCKAGHDSLLLLSVGSGHLPTQLISCADVTPIRADHSFSSVTDSAKSPPGALSQSASLRV
jgi:hypothetical protein